MELKTERAAKGTMPLTLKRRYKMREGEELVEGTEPRTCPINFRLHLHLRRHLLLRRILLTPANFPASSVAATGALLLPFFGRRGGDPRRRSIFLRRWSPEEGDARDNVEETPRVGDCPVLVVVLCSTRNDKSLSFSRSDQKRETKIPRRRERERETFKGGRYHLFSGPISLRKFGEFIG